MIDSNNSEQKKKEKKRIYNYKRINSKNNWTIIRIIIILLIMKMSLMKIKGKRAFRTPDYKQCWKKLEREPPHLWKSWKWELSL